MDSRAGRSGCSTSKGGGGGGGEVGGWRLTTGGFGGSGGKAPVKGGIANATPRTTTRSRVSEEYGMIFIFDSDSSNLEFRKERRIGIRKCV